MRLHVISLPHTQVTREYDWCAYTAKVRRLGGMLAAAGHEGIFYCGEEFEGTGEHVPVVFAADRERWFGHEAPGGEWSTDFGFDHWNSDHPCWREMNLRSVEEIRARWQDGDALALIAGSCQEQIAMAFIGGNPLILEWGVGYEGVLDFSHHAYESQAWRHTVYGHRRWSGRHFDTVIPNAYDIEDFHLADDEGYLLFLGRQIERKGLPIVEELVKNGHRIVTAGQGEPIAGVDHRGVVLGQEKADLIAGATALLAPTLYVEPFGGITVEAMMSGVPAITTDFGCFTETVEPGRTGFRCNTLGEFEAAVRSAPKLRGVRVQARARDRFSTTNVAKLYDQWLRRCALRFDNGWYSLQT